MVLMPLLSRLLTLLVILTMPLFLARLTLIPIKSLSICFRVILISITTILKRRGCLTVPRLTLMSLIKMMLVMVSVAAISKTFGLLRFLLRLSFPSFVSGAMAKAGKGLLEGTLQAGTSAVSDKLLDLVGLGGKSAADKGKDTRDYLAAAFPELNAWERAGADASSAGMVDAG